MSTAKPIRAVVSWDRSRGPDRTVLTVVSIGPTGEQRAHDLAGIVADWIVQAFEHRNDEIRDLKFDLAIARQRLAETKDRVTYWSKLSEGLGARAGIARGTLEAIGGKDPPHCTDDHCHRADHRARKLAHVALAAIDAIPLPEMTALNPSGS